ncbi:MAG: NAD(P)-dependent oxidoreductase [Candidatus Nitronauta litoralis]|uniref:NAD(P)-dependent oxidoreductase n=1 Tax=Candidatus Nitronauta litoralis TaxID=2705533 RepID=A0A7T0BXY1_9BACT|nr:MAG: NAD(P)-dependent oxidoreductase [Candidatus Nitronauta litoralis]
MKKIGYIGLGIMGASMARNLLCEGFEVIVWNRTESRADVLLNDGAKWAKSPEALADQVELICVNVTDTPDVEAVLFGAGGIAGRSGSSPLVVVDHSTISPEATRGFARRLKDRKIDFLDAPVTGGDIGARDATLSIMVGGEEPVFMRSLPVLKAVGKKITYVGENGAGQLCKACNQIMGALNLLGVCEAMALAQKGGLALNKMLEVTGAGAAGSWALDNLGKQIAEGDMEPGFMVDLMRKDLTIVQKEAAGLDLPLLGAGMVERLFQAASEMGHGQKGTQALSRVVEATGKFKFGERPGE